MKLITVDPKSFPEEFWEVLEGQESTKQIYDCSCSRIAQTLCIKTEEEELFLKIAPKDSLKREALMTEWFAKKGLAEHILQYVSYDRDYLLKKGVQGIDLTEKEWLEKPVELCQLYADTLKKIHALDPGGLPEDPICTAFINDGYKDPSLIADTVIHGDYCLPNVITKEGRFEGLIDLGQACLGDKHIDIYWALWSLNFNLKTDEYRDVFLDAYGRDQIDEEKLIIIQREEEKA